MSKQKFSTSPKKKSFQHPRKKQTKQNKNDAKIKVTMIILGISSIYKQIFTCLASLVHSILVQTQLHHYLYHPTLKFAVTAVCSIKIGMKRKY